MPTASRCKKTYFGILNAIFGHFLCRIAGRCRHRPLRYVYKLFRNLNTRSTSTNHGCAVLGTFSCRCRLPNRVVNVSQIKDLGHFDIGAVAKSEIWTSTARFGLHREIIIYQSVFSQIHRGIQVRCRYQGSF